MTKKKEEIKFPHQIFITNESGDYNYENEGKGEYSFSHVRLDKKIHTLHKTSGVIATYQLVRIEEWSKNSTIDYKELERKVL